MTRRLLTVLIATLIASATVVAAPLPAAAQAGEAEVRVATGLEIPRAVIHVEATDRIVVIGDDEAQIWSRAGDLLHTINGLPGAADVDDSGSLIVVAAPDTGELVVIDTTDGTVVRRIIAGAQGAASVAVVGDAIWYAHGPDQWDAGIGLASIADGTATPNYLDGPYSGATVDVSPGRPNQAYYVNNNLSPSNLIRAERNEEGFTDTLRNPYHDSFWPFVVSDSGDHIWAMNNGNVVEIDPEDLTRTGLFYQKYESDDGFRYGNGAIASHEDTRIAVVWSGAVVTHEVGSPAIATTARFQGNIIDVDLDASRLFTLTGAGRYDAQGETSYLTISDFDRELPDKQLVVTMWGAGNAPDERPIVRYQCNTGDIGTFDVLYGWTYLADVRYDADNCVIIRIDQYGQQVQFQAWDFDRFQWGMFNSLTVHFQGDELTAQAEIIDVWPSPLSDIELFVRQQYVDILERPADEGGVAFWRDRIDVGTVSHAQYIESLVDSPEYLGSIAPVSRLYLAYFERWPEEDGLAYWLGRYRNGTSLEEISQNFALSDEFVDTYGSVDDRAFLDLVYANVLGRSADEGGYRFWLDRMADGMSRGAVMTAFSESPENIDKTNPDIVVRALYLGLLQREPDRGGFTFWTETYRSGGSLVSMIDGFINSDEYANRFLIFDDLGPALRQEGATQPVLPGPIPR